ncbi:hypothetical protein AB9P05_15515 [Roseivirga sp. BDSF3-8]|uniref:hypothetical protein n=1 Tax=Roseivirga sp. BDSF3-8 TaxID=3241598 RepID=UPI0035327963
MLDRELKHLWNKSSNTAQISIDTKRLEEEFEAKVHNIQRKIRNRDIREISASVVGIGLFGYLLYEIPFPFTKLACALAIMWFVLIIIKFNKSRIKATPTKASLPISEQLDYHEQSMKKQADLLDSATYGNTPHLLDHF